MTMLPLALLSAVHLRTGSWASAGITTGAYTVSLAVMAPVMGRLVDRRGPRPVLLITGLLHPAVLVALVAALVSSLPVSVVYAGAAAAGASLPVVAPTVRSLWSQLVAAGSPERAAAFALDSVGGELSWVLGPLVVAGALLVTSPVAALLVAAGVCLLGTIAGRAQRPGTAVGAPGRRCAAGRRAVAGTRYGHAAVRRRGADVQLRRDERSECPRPMPSRWGCGGSAVRCWPCGQAGSAISGIWFGTRHIARPLGDQWRWGLLIVAVAIVPLALERGLWIVPFAFVLGATIAPVIIVQNSLVAELAPPGTTTEAFTWITTVAYGTSSLGTSVGGAVVEAAGVPGAFGLAAVAAVMAWTCAYTGRSRVRHAHDARRVLAEQAA